ncbi:MAG: hypothetical protein R3F65_28345 [bacterium]
MPNTTWSLRRRLLRSWSAPHRLGRWLREAGAGVDRGVHGAGGVEGSVDALEAEPFDYAEAAEGLDSMWLRRTFVQACRLVVQVDGRVEPEGADALRAMASALGVGEAAALDDIEGPRPDPGRLVEGSTRWRSTMCLGTTRARATTSGSFRIPIIRWRWARSWW